MEKVPFSQKFFGAVLVAVIGGLIVNMVTEVTRSMSLLELLKPNPGVGSERLPSRPDSKGDLFRSAISSDEEAQRQTVGEIKDIGTAMFSWLTDEVGAAAAGQSQVEGATRTVDLSKIPLISHQELYKTLVPRYLQSIPKADGWNHPYEFYLNTADIMAQQVMGVRSPGRDGRFSATYYRIGPVDPEDVDEDIVWTDGYFVQWPNMKQRGLKN